MLTALISAVRPTETGQLRAGLMLAGRSILSWQAEAASAVGCKRFICLCEAPTEPVLAVQREVEASGHEFHVIKNNVQIAALVRADDTIVMIGDGLLITKEAAVSFGVRDEATVRGIATIPASHTLAEVYPEDFERIDRDRHWAGFAVIRARDVRMLAELPPDGDAMSLLLRMGLQAQEECRGLDEELLRDGAWFLALDDRSLDERERALIRSLVPGLSLAGPGRALAAALVRLVAPRWLDQAGPVSGGCSFALFGLATFLAYAGWPASSLFAAALGIFMAEFGQSWSCFRNGVLGSDSRGWRQRLAEPAVFVGSAIALAMAQGLSAVSATQIGLPLIALGLAHVCGQSAAPSVRAFWQDRVVHMALFAIAATLGDLEPGLTLFAVIATFQLLLHRPD